MGGLGIETGEERLGQPFGEEGVDTDLLEMGRELLVGGAACGALGIVVDASGGTDQDESAEPGAQGHMEGHASSERVPDDDRSLAVGGEELGGADEIGLDLRPRTVAGEIERLHVVVLGEEGAELAPALGGLGEAVEEHDPLGDHGLSVGRTAAGP